jgi:hypothetical protein
MGKLAACQACVEKADKVDYQNRAGANKGSGGVAGASEAAIDRRERLRKLALETIDLAKDPYILRSAIPSSYPSREKS